MESGSIFLAPNSRGKTDVTFQSREEESIEWKQRRSLVVSSTEIRKPCAWSCTGGLLRVPCDWALLSHRRRLRVGRFCEVVRIHLAMRVGNQPPWSGAPHLRATLLPCLAVKSLRIFPIISNSVLLCDNFPLGKQKLRLFSPLAFCLLFLFSKIWYAVYIISHSV